MICMKVITHDLNKHYRLNLTLHFNKNMKSVVFWKCLPASPTGVIAELYLSALNVRVGERDGDFFFCYCK